MVKLGIIGGSGFDDPDLFGERKELKVKTPFGLVPVVCGRISKVDVVFLARHGKTHSVPPHMINYRANLCALKKLGVTHIIATTACGSLKEKLRPGDFVLPDQFIDWTKSRQCTFFDKSVKHVGMAEPFDKGLREAILEKSLRLSIECQGRGTVVTIDGPRFSSKAESGMFRLIGADVVNMTVVPEVVLANELGIPYQAIAMVTDYDCWKEDEEPVSFGLVMERMRLNSKKVKSLLLEVIKGACRWK